MKKIRDSIKYLKLSDLCAPIFFIIALIPSLVLKIFLFLRKKRLWIICEDGISARDNGYFFYKYMCENKSIISKNIIFYYVIKTTVPDYKHVSKMGKTIKFKSLKHWIMYMAAEYNISSQKHGNPNQIFFYILHVVFGLYKNRVFLQHGIIKDMCDWLLYKNTKFKYFICGAKDEYDYVEKNYGYPTGSVQYTGLARFDSLHNYSIEDNTILVMPTWRNWLGREKNNLATNCNFKETQYYKYWNGLLNDKDLIQFIEKNNIIIKFYPHINMIKYIDDFQFNSKNIEKLNTNYNIQQILKSSQLLITDYSSVFMDFAYMGKPIIHYQFDLNEFRSKQYQEGYFKYEKNGFGRICIDKNSVIREIKKLHAKNFCVEHIYKKRMQNFFEIKDTKNCERIYKLLNENR